MTHWEHFQRHYLRWLAAGLTFLLGIIYVLVVPPSQGAGLPMDDTYIHLDFARNLGLYGELALNHGFPSAGTSSLGWDVLIAPAFRMGIDPLWWVLLLSLISQSLAAYGFSHLVQNSVQGRKFAVWTPTLAVVLFAASGPLLWYATSGMETSLFLAFSFLAMKSYTERKRTATILWSGAAVFIRFEAMLLVLTLAIWDLFHQKGSLGKRLKQDFILLFFPFLFYLPAMIANLATEGTPYPGTFLGRVMLLTLTFIPFDPSRLGLHLTNWTTFLLNWFYGMNFFNGIPRILILPFSLATVALPVLAYAGIGMGLLALGGRRNAPSPIFIWWTVLTWLVIGSILPIVIYAGRYEAQVLPLLIWGIAVAVGWMAKFLEGRLRLSLSRSITIAMLFLIGIYAFCGYWAWMGVRTKAVEHIGNVHVKMGFFCRALPADKTVASFDVGAVKYLNPQREIVDWAGLTDAGMRNAIKHGRGLEYLKSKSVAFLTVMEGPKGEIHPYPFNLAYEVRSGSIKLERDFPSERGMQPLPSFATAPEDYAAFISAVLVAEDRMTMYRIIW